MKGRREAVVVIGAMLVMVSLSTISSLSLGPVARRMPLVVAIPTLLLLARELAREMRRDREDAGRPSRHASERALFLWIGGLLALILVAGMAAGVPLFLLAYMRRHFHESWRASLALAGTFAILLVAVLQYLLGVPLHPGLIGGWLEAAS